MVAAKRKTANPRKLPEQGRSRATVEAIVDAAAHILVKQGYDAFTTNRVAEKAGVSIGSLYQYFPNKESLISELNRRHVMEIERSIVAISNAPPSMPIEELIRTSIELNVASHTIDPELHRVLSDEVPRLGQLDWQRDYYKRLAKRVRDLFEARRAELAVGDLDLAVYVVTRTVEALVHNAVSDRPQDLKSGALAAEVTRLIVGYLTGKPMGMRRPARAAE